MEPVIPVYQQNLLYFGSEQPGIGGEKLGSCEEAKISQEVTIPSLHGIDCFRTRRRSLHTLCKAVFVSREQTRTLIYQCDQARSNNRSRQAAAETLITSSLRLW